jgi:protein associated with RNAse G/E
MEDDLTGRPVPIHITKYDGSYHRRWPVYYVLRKGPLFLTECRVGDIVAGDPDAADGAARWPIRWGGDVFLWDDRWYNASRMRRENRTWYYVNVATPVEFDGDAFHCVDLDLDVSWYTDEAPRVLDEDEFLDHSKAMGYPAHVIERARSAVDDVLRLIHERAFPFDRP